MSDAFPLIAIGRTFAEPALMFANAHDMPSVVIYADGRIELAEGVTLDDAARLIYDRVSVLLLRGEVTS